MQDYHGLWRIFKEHTSIPWQIQAYMDIYIYGYTCMIIDVSWIYIYN